MIKYHETYDKKWFLKDSKLCYEYDENLHEAENSDILDLNDPNDMCIGIIGDGCGGGRIFIADTGNDMIKVYDPQSAEVFVIIKDIQKPNRITKKGCILSIYTDSKDQYIEFDLSSMTKSIKIL